MVGIKGNTDIHSDNETYHIHLTTKNISFIKLFKQLRDEGVKNNKFFLKLYDKTLMNVDPHDEDNLTSDQKARIWNEVKRNPWYYLREVCRVPVAGRNKSFELHKGNLAIAWAKLMNFRFIGILPRQNYKTVTALCVDTWIYNYATNNTNVVYSNKGAGDAQRNLLTFKGVIEVLPSYLKVTDKKDTDNATFIRTAINNNTIRLAPNPQDPEGADKAG